MQQHTQNIHFFKPNKSPPKIHLPQLPTPQPLKPPNFSSTAFKPLPIDFLSIKKKFHQQLSVNHQQRQQIIQAQSNTELRPFPKDTLQSLKKQNDILKQELSKINFILEQEKHKYNLLKNLYKQGEVMFEKLQQNNLLLQRQNKQIKTVLENVLKELHMKNQNLESLKPVQKPVQNPALSRRIQKVKIGNKQIPVIKVNVPPQTFIKKEHSSSVHSINQQNGSNQKFKGYVEKLENQNQKLNETNKQLNQELKELKASLSKLELTFLNQQNKKQQKQHNETQSVFYLPQKQISKPFSPQLNIKQGKQTNVSSDSFHFSLSNTEKETTNNVNFHSHISNYNGQENNVSYYKSKYTILETQLKKKDQTIKNLYDQCYLLQFELNKLKTSPYKSADLPAKTNEKTGNDYNFHTEPKTQKQQESQTLFYKRKINELQTQIKSLNQLCIGNINNSFKLNELNESIIKMKKQIQIYQQKNSSQQAELRRLYKILENKNLELSQIYSVISQTKKSQLFEGSKLFEESKMSSEGVRFMEQSYLFEKSKKKQVESGLMNTPQKYENLTSRNLVQEKQDIKNCPTQ